MDPIEGNEPPPLTDDVDGENTPAPAPRRRGTFRATRPRPAGSRRASTSPAARRSTAPAWRPAG